MVVLLLTIFLLSLFYLLLCKNRGYTYSRMTWEDIEEIELIEKEVYEEPNEIPGTYIKEQSINECPDLSLVMRENGKIIGMMYALMLKGTKMTNEKLDRGHVSDGDTLVIYSMCVRKDYQRRGIGRILSKYYYDEWINNKNGAKRQIKYFSTPTKKKYLNFCKDLGYKVMGPSEINYGSVKWYDILKENKDS